MRYKPGQKEETRQKILDAASRSFRKNGYSGIGVDALAKAAGVTSGAFYTHFGSKDAAFSEALRIGLDEVIAAVPVFQSEHGAAWIEAFANYYLGKPHRADLACGCAIASLTTEVVRSDRSVHKAYETKMVTIATLMAKGLAGGSQKERLARAWAVLSLLIGGLNVARAVEAPKVANQIADSVIASASLLAGETIASTG